MNEKNLTKDVIITDGTATSNILNGSYTVSSAAAGYDNTSLDPKTVVVSADTTVISFKISATGTLTLHVTEDGTAGGTPVVGAVFARCDKNGTTYGNTITTDASGNATFSNVPFGETSTSNVYYKQTASDGSHTFDDTLKTVQLTQSATTVEVTNAPAPERTINLTDANYNDLPIESATLTFQN